MGANPRRGNPRLKTVSNALKAHLAQEVTSLCVLVKFTRKDGTVFGYSNSAEDVTYLGQLYKSDTGHSPSSVKTIAALNVDNLEIKTVLDTATITEVAAMAGLWDYARCEVIQVNYKSLADGGLGLRKGWLGELKLGRKEVTVELRGMTQPLQQIIGRIYAISCDADLGDARCGFNLATAGFTVTGSATSVTNQHLFTDSTRTEAARFFEGGKLTWTAGANNTYQMEVKSFSGGVIDLQQAMANPITIGDAYSMTAGCDKTRSTCVTKFSNIANHRGYPDLPGADRYVSGT